MENKVYKVILVQQQTSDDSKIDVKQAGRNAAWSYLGQSAKQQIKDRAFTAFTGQKAERENHGKVTFGKVGQTYVDQNGQQRTMSMGDAKQRNKEAASNIGKDVVAKMTKPVDKGAMSTKSGTQEFGKPNVRPDIGPD